MKELLFNTFLLLFILICWGISFNALLNSDGKCEGICEYCVYSGNCPQEKKEEENERKQF
jgi:hypothetical protein